MGQAQWPQRRKLIDAEHPELSLRRQCVLLGINRSTLYYAANAPNVDDISLLNEIRDVWERYPFFGYRRITLELRARGYHVNRKRVERLMVWDGIQATHPGPNTSRRNKLHAVHPYLLRDFSINRENQVWMIDITYLRMSQDLLYLVALIDVYSRYVVGWSLANTLETSFYIEARNQV